MSFSDDGSTLLVAAASAAAADDDVDVERGGDDGGDDVSGRGISSRMSPAGNDFCSDELDVNLRYQPTPCIRPGVTI